MKNALELIVKNIVDNPEKVAIEEVTTENGIELLITADPKDIGKIIGREGKIIRAIRNVMKIIAMKENQKLFIRIQDQQPSIE